MTHRHDREMRREGASGFSSTPTRLCEPTRYAHGELKLRLKVPVSPGQGEPGGPPGKE